MDRKTIMGLTVADSGYGHQYDCTCVDPATTDVTTTRVSGAEKTVAISTDVRLYGEARAKGSVSSGENG